MQTVQIIFLGLCLLMNMTVGNQNSKRVILPQLKNESDSGIARHKAFVAFPADALVESHGWDSSGTLSKKLTHNVPWVWFPLDGDEVSISMAADPFMVDPSYDAGIDKLRKHCPSFVALSPDYAFGTDSAKKAAQIDLTHGKLFMRQMFRGMKASRLQAQTKGPVVISARSWQTGQTRSVTVNVSHSDSDNQGDIWIGNMRDEFFLPDANPDTPDKPGMNDFLAYYRMASTKTGCTWQPSSAPTAKGFGVGCSNSNFP